MTRKKIWLLTGMFLAILPVFTQNARLNFRIEGLNNKQVVLEHVTDKVTQVFAGPADEKGHLTISAPLSEYGFYRVNLDKGKEVFFIVAGPDDKITFTSSMGNLLRAMKVEGSDLNEKQLRIKYVNDSIKAVLSAIEKEHKILSASSGNEASMRDLAEKYTRIQNERVAMLKKYLEENRSSLTVLFFTDEVKLENEPELYDRIVEALTAKYPENYFVKDLRHKVMLEKSTRIGSIAPDIALPNPDGDTIRLSSLRGKIVLLDFWAAWCGPCRRENPNVVRLYNQYKDKGFEIYGVSLDRDRASWLRGIQEDKLTWILVSDLKYWSSGAARLYGVTSIPHAILLDREGRIIAKKIRSHDLERLLQEIFAKEGK